MPAPAISWAWRFSEPPGPSRSEIGVQVPRGDSDDFRGWHGRPRACILASSSSRAWLVSKATPGTEERMGLPSGRTSADLRRMAKPLVWAAVLITRAVVVLLSHLTTWSIAILMASPILLIPAVVAHQVRLSRNQREPASRSSSKIDARTQALLERFGIGLVQHQSILDEHGLPSDFTTVQSKSRPPRARLGILLPNPDASAMAQCRRIRPSVVLRGWDFPTTQRSAHPRRGGRPHQSERRMLGGGHG